MSQRMNHPELWDAAIRLDDRAQRLRECLSAQLEADYPITYERADMLVRGVLDYLPLIRDAAELALPSGEKKPQQEPQR